MTKFTTLLMSGAVAGLLAAAPVAMAQTTTTPAPAPTAPSVTTPGAVKAPVANATDPAVIPGGQADAKKLIGRNIKNANNDTVGEIKSVFLDKDGKVQTVIVGVGGFLGMGEREVALAWSDLQVSNNGEQVMVNMTKDQLKGLPEYKYTDPKYRGTVFTDTTG
jgi:sporulation protein YlmC with PRC-barrel domain